MTVFKLSTLRPITEMSCPHTPSATHVNMGNQSRKDKRLPSHATATYQPIQPMTDEEYNEQYMAAITRNPPASTPATNTPYHKPNPSNSRPPRPALPLCLPSCAILPTRHHSYPPQ
ncbi:hypothetical protein DSO57_1025878 [Entomophthora muscae]|uniref:Uncharacterized protein n=1 Tax=Entomophthora muscae TaxID=34485 RepID=A0ACC2U0K6_9FUNG|nr:hypothetical protein DSO57_1025878 [Entomophthora muscae]